MSRRRKNHPGPPQWSRLPHEDLGMPAGTGEPAAIPEPQLLASGRFADPHPRNGRMPPAPLSRCCPSSGDLSAIDPEKVREGVSAALGSLWIFNAAVAALYLVMPDAARR